MICSTIARRAALARLALSPDDANCVACHRRIESSGLAWDHDDLKSIEEEAKNNQYAVKAIVRAVARSDPIRKRQQGTKAMEK